LVAVTTTSSRASAAYTCVHATAQNIVAARPQLSFQRVTIGSPQFFAVNGFVVGGI
jgi:hypothetical protein